MQRRLLSEPSATNEPTHAHRPGNGGLDASPRMAVLAGVGTADLTTMGCPVRVISPRLRSPSTGMEPKGSGHGCDPDQAFAAVGSAEADDQRQPRTKLGSRVGRWELNDMELWISAQPSSGVGDGLLCPLALDDWRSNQSSPNRDD